MYTFPIASPSLYNIYCPSPYPPVVPYMYLQTPYGRGSGPPPPKGTCPIRHLEDMEVVPHPKMLSSKNNQNKQSNPKSETSSKTKIRPMCYDIVHLVRK